MFKWLKDILYKENESINRPEHFYIDMMQYDYIVSEIYNNMLFVDVDIDSCEVERGEYVKLLNEIYTVVNTEFFAEKTSHRWRIVLVKE